MKLTFLEYLRIAVFAALGIAMIVYGLAVKRAATGTAFYRVWVLGGALFLLMAVSCVFRFRQKLPSAVRNAGLAIFIIGCVLLLLTEMLILSHFGDKDQDADWVIVLGAQVFEDRPSLVLKYRLDKAAEYLKSHPDTKCIVSGGKGTNEPFSEAHGMSRYLIIDEYLRKFGKLFENASRKLRKSGYRHEQLSHFPRASHRKEEGI